MINKDRAKALLEVLDKEYEQKKQAVLDKLPKKEREQFGEPAKNVSELKTFHANGVKYIVRESLSIARFREFEKLQIDVGYGVGMDIMFNNILKAFNYLNVSQPADAAVVLHNTMSGIKDNIDGRQNEVLAICALFICREEEDLTKYDEVLTAAKIKDWEQEGITMESFFSFAFNLVPNFTAILEQVSVNTSIGQEKKTHKKKKKVKL